MATPGDSSATMRGEPKKKLIPRCTKHKVKTRLERTPCAPDTKRAERAAAGGEKRQEPVQPHSAA